MRLLLASRNPGKLMEIRSLLEGSGWEAVGLDSLERRIEVEEDGATFEANARKKARAAARATGMWTLADDSGLEVDALAGEPGVHSARYSGVDASQRHRNQMLLDRLVEVPEERRTARFRAVVCLVSPDGREVAFEGTCEGRIAHHPRGSGGFGYDPLFVPEGYSRTFAELGLEVKNRISHRAKALRQAVGYLGSRECAESAPGKRS